MTEEPNEQGAQIEDKDLAFVIKRFDRIIGAADFKISFILAAIILLLGTMLTAHEWLWPDLAKTVGRMWPAAICILVSFADGFAGLVMLVTALLPITRPGPGGGSRLPIFSPNLDDKTLYNVVSLMAFEGIAAIGGPERLRQAYNSESYMYRTDMVQQAYVLAEILRRKYRWANAGGRLVRISFITAFIGILLRWIAS